MEGRNRKPMTSGVGVTHDYRADNEFAPKPKDSKRKTHYLKTTPEFFKAVKSGEKTFEARLNDRNYQVGDTLVLQEWLPHTMQYSGDEIVKTVTYLLDHKQFCTPGYVIMSLGEWIGSNG